MDLRLSEAIFMIETKFTQLLNDPTLKVWYDKLCIRNEGTAKYYLWSIHDLMNFAGATDAKTLIGKIKALPNIYDFLGDYVAQLDQRKMAPYTIRNRLNATRRFLVFNDIEINRDKVKDKVILPETYTVTEDRIPEPHELRRIFDIADLRKKIVILLLVHGLRVSEVGTLRVKDLYLDDKEQPHLTLYAGNTKKRKGRIVCLTPETVQYLREYLSTFNPIDLLLKIKPESGTSADSVRKYVKGLLDKAGLNQKDENTDYYILHPHTLRKYCKTMMEQAGLPESFIDKHIGHKRYLDESYFKPNKEMIKQQFQKAVPFLTIQKEMIRASADMEDKVKNLERELAAEKKDSSNRIEALEKRINQMREFTLKWGELDPEIAWEALMIAEELKTRNPTKQELSHGHELTKKEIRENRAKLKQQRQIPK